MNTYLRKEKQKNVFEKYFSMQNQTIIEQFFFLTI